MIDLPFLSWLSEQFIREWVLERLKSFHFTSSLWEGNPKTEMKAEYSGLLSTQTVWMCIIDRCAYQQGANDCALTVKSRNFRDMLSYRRWSLWIETAEMLPGKYQVDVCLADDNKPAVYAFKYLSKEM